MGLISGGGVGGAQPITPAAAHPGSPQQAQGQVSLKWAGPTQHDATQVPRSPSLILVVCAVQLSHPLKNSEYPGDTQ